MSHPADRALVGKSVETMLTFEREIGSLLRRVRRVLDDRAQLVHPSLQGSGYLILSYLDERGELRSADIVAAFNIDKGAVSRQVQQLVEFGLVERHQDESDRRAWVLRPTEATHRRLDKVAGLRRQMLHERLSDWSDEEFETLVDLIARYNASLDS